ncbi:MAG: DUF6089 family protein [Chitinophagaceae bacterium]
MIKEPMVKQLLFYCLLSGLLCFTQTANAQYEGYVHEGEFGIQVGAAHYFGDLNPNARVNRPKPTAGIFLRKQINNYVALRLAGNVAFLGYSDIYEKKNLFRQRRNLSFNTTVWEALVQGDFNFFRFNPTNPNERFTPYLTFGAGIFKFDPWADLNGTKYFLQPLGTEGQESAVFPNKKKYKLLQVAIPFGFGVKYAVNSHTNFHFEITHRFTTTDYLDDVSTTYAGLSTFVSGSPAAYLQDRSYETGIRIGERGVQRGFSGQKDQYMTATIGVTFNITSYRCPSAQ